MTERMLKKTRGFCAAGLVGLLLSGCASLSAQMAFDDVALSVEERTGKRIQWDEGSDADIAARGTVAALLSRPLSMQSAIQIALLNNRGLQSTYTEVGIAQAGLVQAGLLKNPAFDIAISDPVPSNLPLNLAFGVVFQFIDALYIPLRRRVAASKLEEAKISVASQVIDHAAMTQSAFVEYVAARQLEGLFKQVEKSARASFEAARIIREAGNSTSLQFERQQSLLTQAKLDLASAEAMKAEAREKINLALGLTGPQTRWRASSGYMLKLSGRRLSLAGMERRAVERSLDLAAGRQRLITLAHQYGVDTATSIIPDLEIGFEAEREEAEKEWQRGPTFELVLPIFDQGRAKRRAAEMQIRKAQDLYWDTAVMVRSAARAVRVRLKMARQQVTYYNRAVLPQTAKILAATQLQYNGMQLGVFQLLLAKRDQIQAGQRYIKALQAYWSARIQYQQLMAGRLPSGGAQMGATQTASAPAEGGGH